MLLLCSRQQREFFYEKNFDAIYFNFPRGKRKKKKKSKLAINIQKPPAGGENKNAPPLTIFYFIFLYIRKKIQI